MAWTFHWEAAVLFFLDFEYVLEVFSPFWCEYTVKIPSYNCLRGRLLPVRQACKDVCLDEDYRR